MLYFPATQSNRDAIWAVLKPLVKGVVLEVASGSGEHVAYFQELAPMVMFIPSDPEPAHRESIKAWTHLEPLDYAVGGPLPQILPDPRVDGIMAINLIHIAPWAVTGQLMSAARKLLKPGGFLYLYGAYKRNGVHTAPSNEAFDRGLQEQNPSWGVRNLEDVVAAAEGEGLRLEKVVEMPANNLSVILRS